MKTKLENDATLDSEFQDQMMETKEAVCIVIILVLVATDEYFV